MANTYPRGLEDIWPYLRIFRFFGLFAGSYRKSNPTIMVSMKPIFYWLLFLAWTCLLWGPQIITNVYLWISSGQSLAGYVKAYSWFTSSIFDRISFYFPIVLAEVSMAIMVVELYYVAKQLPDFLSQLTFFHYSRHHASGDEDDNPIRNLDLMMSPVISRALKFIAL